MLIEFHILQNHAPSNLNRDETGTPKECVFGGAKRSRISSQCLKRAIRRSDVFRTALDGNLATRTRRLPELVKQKLISAGFSEEIASEAGKKVSGFGNKDGKEREAAFDTAQTIFLTENDIRAVTDVLTNAITGKSLTDVKALKALDLQGEAQDRGYRQISVDMALFGRMVTSSAFRNVDACAQVAHAISTHKVEHEFDFFTAVDDLQSIADGDDAGADMMGDVEYNSACYYKYISVDADGLVANLTGASAGRKDIPEDEVAEAKELAAVTIAALLESAVMVSPSGKQNTFAAHQLPSLVLVECRPQKTPVSYANAFVDPASPSAMGGDLIQASLGKLAVHAEKLTSGFCLKSDFRFALSPEYTFSMAGVTAVSDLGKLRELVKQAVQGHE